MNKKTDSLDTLSGQKLHGEIIGHVFELSPTIGELHQTVTSPRGNHFRLRVLQKARNTISLLDVQALAKREGLQETKRHLHKLLAFNLIEEVSKGNYQRTELGEEVINRVKELERKFGKASIDKLYSANLGRYSIQLFLAVYGQKKHFSLLREMFNGRNKLEIKYSPARIGRIAGFLPRDAEAIASIDKLNLAGILVYEDDGYVHLKAEKARAFYQYLKRLYEIVLKIE